MHSGNSNFLPLRACDILVSCVVSHFWVRRASQVTPGGARMWHYRYCVWSSELLQLRTSPRRMWFELFPAAVFKVDWNIRHRRQRGWRGGSYCGLGQCFPGWISGNATTTGVPWSNILSLPWRFTAHRNTLKFLKGPVAKPCNYV